MGIYQPISEEVVSLIFRENTVFPSAAVYVDVLLSAIFLLLSLSCVVYGFKSDAMKNALYTDFLS